jgi:arginine/ornithine N-succinyltransferase beta subunit
MSLNITEYIDLADDGPGSSVMAGLEPNRKTQDVAVSAVPAQSEAFDSATRFIRLHTTEDIRIAVGENPTATATSTRLGAGATEFFGVHPGHKISVMAE